MLFVIICFVLTHIIHAAGTAEYSAVMRAYLNELQKKPLQEIGELLTNEQKRMISVAMLSLLKAKLPKDLKDQSIKEAVLHMIEQNLRQTNEMIQKMTKRNGTVKLSDRNLKSIQGLYFPPDLKCLDLGGNQIRDISPLSAANLPELTLLDLRWNQITDIVSFENMPELRCLYLSDNQIRSIPEFDLPNLESLRLDKNQIGDISPLMTAELPELIDLFLSQNQIIDIGSFENMANLRYLNLRGNRIRNISTFNLPNLGYLNLRGNQITNISPLITANLPQLTDFNLSQNQIVDIVPFENMANLRKLHLSGNQITSTEPLRDMVNLTELDLSNNKIINISSLQYLTKLESLSLQNNRIEDIQSLVGIRGLEFCNLDNNRLSKGKCPKPILHLWHQWGVRWYTQRPP